MVRWLMVNEYLAFDHCSADSLIEHKIVLTVINELCAVILYKNLVPETYSGLWEFHRTWVLQGKTKLWYRAVS